jgi:hypothetical protein
MAIIAKGESKMCGCNAAKIPPAGKPVSFLTSSGNLDVAGNQITGDPSQMVMVEYVGPVEGTFSIRSRVSKNVTYRFGNNEYNKNKAVFIGDAEYLIGQIGREGIPLYRVLNAPTNSEGYDPVAFLGTPITA